MNNTAFNNANNNNNNNNHHNHDWSTLSDGESVPAYLFSDARVYSGSTHCTKKIYACVEEHKLKG